MIFRRRRRSPSVIVQTRDGRVLSPYELRSGMAIVATDYRHRTRSVTLTVDQSDDIYAAIVAAVNGAIGGKVGLGYEPPGYAGKTAQ